MIYMDVVSKQARKRNLKESKYIEKKVYRALNVAYPRGCGNLSKLKKARNLHFRFS